MSAVLQWITDAVGRRPVAVIALTLLITLGLASRIPEGELVNDTTAFSPVTDEVLAAEEIAERFGDASTATVQVVVTGDDVVGADGMATVTAIADLAEQQLGDALVGERATVSFLAPALAAAEAQGLDPITLGDDQVDRLQQRALDGPPSGTAPGEADGATTDGPAQLAAVPAGVGDAAGLASALIAGDDPVDAGIGLVLVQIDGGAFGSDGAAVDAQVAFAEEVIAADLPLEATPFSLDIISSPDDDFQAEVGQLFALAAGVILVVLAFVLRARRGPRLGRAAAVRRSLADMVSSIGAVVLAVIWVQGLTVLLGPSYLGIVGQASPPTQIIPVLLLALGVDYTIHLQSRYREEIAAGVREPASVVRRLGPTVGVALFLSMVTTAVGFLTNLASPIPAIQDLGVLAAVGIVSAFVLSLTFLPAVRSLLDRGPAARDELVVDEVAPREDAFLARVALVGLRPALGAPVAMLTATVALAGAGVFGLTQLETEFDFTAFLPDDSPYAGAVTILEEEFGGGLAEVTEVLVTGDVLDVDVHNAYAEAAVVLDGADGVVELAGGPDLTTPVTVFAQLRPSGADQEQALATAVDAGLLPDGTLAAESDVAVVYGTLARAFPVAAGVVEPAGDEPAVRLAVRTQSDAVGVGAVTEVLAAAVSPVEAAGADTVVTSQAIITDDITTSLRDSQVRGLVTTVVAVMLLLGLVYGIRSRQPGLGVLVMLPVVAVVLWTFGLMALTGIPFDPVTAVISALVVGLGVDFCIHLGERFVEDMEVEGGDVAAALRSSLRHTGAALAGSAATTMLGFSVLTTASITPFQRLGVVTIYAVGLSLVATLFVLPSLLVIYGRRRARRGSVDVGSTAPDRRGEAIEVG